VARPDRSDGRGSRQGLLGEVGLWTPIASEMQHRYDDAAAISEGRTMSNTFRERSVAVAVIYDQPTQAFLLWHNKRWHGYAFPMKHFDPSAAVSPAEVALQSLEDRDFPLSLRDPSATPLDRVGHCLLSEGVHQYTYYDYYVFAVDTNGPINRSTLDPDLRLFTYDELVAAQNVTSSTKMIAESFVQDRQVAVAVITRQTQRGREFLLTRNKLNQFFFPATRIKSDASPAHAVVQAVRLDLAYEGEVVDVNQQEVPVVQGSLRFGPGQRRFHFHLCLLKLPGVDLSDPGNELAKALNDFQAALLSHQPTAAANSYWGWLTEDEIRNRADVSPSGKTVIVTAVQLAERNR
jgi:hypothetical protein